MRKHTLLNFACSGVAIVLSCLPGAWSAPRNTTSGPVKRDITVNDDYCIGEWKTAVTTAVRDALNIVSYAIPRFEALLANLNSNPVPSIIGMSAADRTVFQTYEAFFGQAYFGVDTVTNRNKNAAAIARLNGLISTAKRVRDALANPPSVNVEIYCSDYFLLDVGPGGVVGAAGALFDSRKWTPNNRVGEWVSLQGLTCANNPDMSAYAYHPNTPPFNGETVIVLCQGYLPGWSARYSQGDTPSRYHDGLPVVPNRYQMDYLWGYLPATLIHEFTHARSVMKQNAVLADQCLINQQPAYQWQCIHQLAQENADFAATNADSFSLFVTAIYFNQNDWSTGIGQKLGYFPLAQT